MKMILGIDDIITAVQRNELRWYWRVSRDWMDEEKHGLWTGRCKTYI